MPEELDLSELLHNPGMRVPTDVDVPCTPELEVDCTSPVTGRLVFTNTGNVLVIQGEATVNMKSRCPRCLTEVQSQLVFEVDEEFTVEHDQVMGRADDEAGAPDPGLADLFTAGHLLDLTELLRQSIVLSEGTEPLCRDDCAGLCPQCGANRNEAPCDCAPPVDSPFAALAGLYEGESPAGGEETTADRT